MLSYVVFYTCPEGREKNKQRKEIEKMNIQTITLRKINARTARRLYAESRPFIMVPCKCGPTSMLAYRLNRESYETLGNDPFISAVNAFRYYNCNAETGYRVAFYMEV